MPYGKNVASKNLGKLQGIRQSFLPIFSFHKIVIYSTVASHFPVCLLTLVRQTHNTLVYGQCIPSSIQYLHLGCNIVVAINNIINYH